jgi:Flp pilus assembly protein TadG
MTTEPVRTRILRRDRHGRGQALVEFALVIPIFLLLLVSIFDLGRAVFAYNTLTNAAREGARMAIVNQYKPSVLEHAKGQTAIIELDDPSVSVTYWQVGSDGNPDTSKPQCTNLVAVGCLAVVTFEATYHPITPIISNLLFGSGVTFRSTAQLPVEFSCPPDLSAATAAADSLLCPKQP